MKKNLLINLGLADKEAEVYLLLLEKGPLYIKDILFFSQLKRGNAYYILDQLEEKGLLRKETKNKKTQFSPRSPEQLNLLVSEQEKTLQSASAELEHALPALQALFQSAAYKPQVKFFTGVEGLKKIHQLILEEKQEILAYVNIKQEWDNVLGDEFWETYYRTRKKQRISVRAIALDNAEGQAYKKRDSSELRETRLIDHQKFPIEIEKNICGNKVALLSLKPEEQIGVLIESSAIAATERSMFELSWEHLAAT